MRIAGVPIDSSQTNSFIENSIEAGILLGGNIHSKMKKTAQGTCMEHLNSSIQSQRDPKRSTCVDRVLCGTAPCRRPLETANE
jgi:hypothetical protein